MGEQVCLAEFPERSPLDGTFELTVRCNLRCKMCLFRHKDSENQMLCNQELTADQWIDMGKQAAEAGTLNLLITGGEPMIRKDFCEIWEGLYQQGFMLQLYTNATRVTSQVMDTLRKFPPHKIGITIYGASPETYEVVCGNANGFFEMLDGVRQLKQLPSLIECRTTIIKENFSDVDRIEEVVHRLLGKETVLTQTRTVMQSVRGACADVRECRLTPDENIRLYFRRELQEIERKVGHPLDLNKLQMKKISKPEEVIRKQRLTLFYCDAGMSSYTITWDGMMQGCQILGSFRVNAVEKGLINAWKEYPSIVEIPEENSQCQNCGDKEFCSKCYAMSYAETGRLDGCPQYACEDARVLKQYYQ